MIVLAILGVIVLALLAAAFWVAGDVLGDEGHDRAARRCTVLAAALAGLAVLGGVKVALGQSGAHGDGHAQGHDVYRHWRAPDNPHLSCCNDEDCRPTRAYMGDDGLWRAWDGLAWLTVPAGRVLPTDFAGDGRSHLCERSGAVLCFTPGQPRG